jgi:hypothetical protein
MFTPGKLYKTDPGNYVSIFLLSKGKKYEILNHNDVIMFVARIYCNSLGRKRPVFFSVKFGFIELYHLNDKTPLNTIMLKKVVT